MTGGAQGLAPIQEVINTRVIMGSLLSSGTSLEKGQM